MNKIEKIAVLGAGVMGTAVAFHLSNIGHQANLWGTELDEQVIEILLKTRKQEELGINIPEGINVFRFHEIKEVLKGRKVVIFCVKAEGVKKVSKCIAPYLEAGMVILNIAKGIPDFPHLTLCDLFKSKIPKNLSSKISVVAMGGPARAIEIVRGILTEVIFTSSDPEAAKLCCKIFRSPTFITSFTSDTVGVELCAAMKNSFAIAIGIGDGLQRGDNLKAAFMARSTTEMAKIVVAKGGKVETVLGPAGIGDLYVTSQGGRNRTLGKLLGQGVSIKQALKEMKGQTVEGYTTLKEIHRVATELEKEGKLTIQNDLFLFHNLYKIVYENRPVQVIVQNYGDRRGGRSKRKNS